MPKKKSDLPAKERKYRLIVKVSPETHLLTKESSLCNEKDVIISFKAGSFFNLRIQLDGNYVGVVFSFNDNLNLGSYLSSDNCLGEVFGCK
jgi:hypothetical protein